MLEGVKALFKFTMAILYLAFQISPPSSSDVFAAIRNTARDLYDIKLLLTIVDQIHLPKDSYFAIRRSFYMVQSSFNSDQFYIQTLSNEASRSMCANKPLSVQQAPDTKPPAVSSFHPCSLATINTSGLQSKSSHFASYQQVASSGLMRLASGPANRDSSLGFALGNSLCADQTMQAHLQRCAGAMGCCPPARLRTSANRSKVCIQSLGKLGRSYLKIMDSNVRANERSLLSPLRNCLVIGLSNCGKELIVARQSSRRNFKSFCEQDITFHVHELSSEIFDGFYLEEMNCAIVLTHQDEVLKMSAVQAQHNRQQGSNLPASETLMLRDSCQMGAIGKNAKLKLRQATIDPVTKLLWIYVETEEQAPSPTSPSRGHGRRRFKRNNPFCELDSGESECENDNELEIKANNLFSEHPFRNLLARHLDEAEEVRRLAAAGHSSGPKSVHRGNPPHGQHKRALAPNIIKQRKILIIDVVTFDIFSAFTIPSSFGEITNLRASLTAYFQLSNPMSNQFSSRIVQIGPNGHYEQLLSFSDVVDYLVSVPESFKLEYQRQQTDGDNKSSASASQKYASLKRLLTRSISFNNCNSANEQTAPRMDHAPPNQSGTIGRYCKSLMKSYSTAVDKTACRPEVSDPGQSSAGLYCEPTAQNQSPSATKRQML